jgi:nucleotidyltransferase/DNA polymerase involved in DNA repair
VQFACVFIDHLPVKAEVQRTPGLARRPVLLANGSGAHRVVVDASPLTVGVVAGMPLSEALSLSKAAVLVEPDPVHYRTLYDRVLDAIEALGADVEDEELGQASVEISGLALLHGGEDRLLAALLSAVPAYLAPRIGVGPNKFVATIAARQARPGSVFHTPDDRHAPENLAQSLAPLPVDLLPVPWQTIARLRGYGLRTMGQVAALSPGALSSQFGPEGKRVGELAHGIDPRPLTPRPHEEAVTASMAFPDPVGTIGIVLTAVESLLTQLFAQQHMRGRFARVCTIEAPVFRAPAWHRRMVFKEPLGDRSQAFTVITHALQNVPPPGPLEELRLTLSSLTGEGGRQESLFRDVRRQENLKEALRQLRARLGGQAPIYHIREVEPWSRLPERRQALVPFSP